ARSTQAPGPVVVRSRFAALALEAAAGQVPKARAKLARSLPSIRSLENPSPSKFARRQIARGSQTLPIPFPSASSWRGFQTNGQLSQASPIRSPSASTPARLSSTSPLQLSSRPLQASSRNGCTAAAASLQSPQRLFPARAQASLQTAKPSLSSSGQIGSTVIDAGMLRSGLVGSLLVTSM